MGGERGGKGEGGGSFERRRGRSGGLDKGLEQRDSSTLLHPTSPYYSTAPPPATNNYTSLKNNTIFFPSTIKIS